MPRGDRTGPWDMGPRTGWGMGYCAGYSMPGFANPYNPRGGRGRFCGRGGGRGFGRGWNHGYLPTLTPHAQYPADAPYYSEPYQPTAEQEKSDLEQLSKSLEAQLGQIKERMKELASKKPKE